MNRMYVFNEDGVAEYVIAETKNLAINHIINLWGHDIWEVNRHGYMIQGLDYQGFLDEFVRELDDDIVFKLETEEGCFVTKTVREHIQDQEQQDDFESPMWFAAEE